ncbi:MAG: TIGR00645 family protein [Deltaproteobacteria bacterium]|nr:TIGR00645 family protein [Deltaproteobacteria bacterium]
MERSLEKVIFQSRWLLAPLYLGLVGSLFLVAIKFFQDLVGLIRTMTSGSESNVILAILSLLDIVLVANLLVMVIFAGYENFVSKLETQGHPDRPPWMGTVDLSGLKFSLLASIVAISAIQLLKSFMHIEDLTDRELYWQVAIHLTFVVSGLLLALSDRIKRKDNSSFQAAPEESRNLR